MEAGTPQARYAILTESQGEWQARAVEVEYDYERAAGQADRNGRPDWAIALRTGKIALSG